MGLTDKAEITGEGMGTWGGLERVYGEEQRIEETRREENKTRQHTQKVEGFAIITITIQ